MASTLTYFFGVENKLQYHETINTVLGSKLLKITMPDNSDQSTMILNIVEENVNTGNKYYYTLYSINVGLTPTIQNTVLDNSTYSLILEGNRNDYQLDTTNKILVIIPIMNKNNTNSSALLNEIINNIPLSTETSDIIYTSTNGININDLIPDESCLIYNITQTSINYKIVLFKVSHLYSDNNTSYTNLKDTINPANNPTIAINLNEDPIEGDVINNEQSVNTVITSDDIYIDCSPVDNNGDKIDNYLNIDKASLDLVNINHLNVWIFKFLSFFILIIIVFVVYKIIETLYKPVDKT